MKFKFIFVGKTKEKWIIEGENEYLKRIQKESQLENIIVNSTPKGDMDKIIKQEGRTISEKIKPTDFVCLLISSGDIISSAEFAKKIENWTFSGSTVVFIIGGSYGVCQEIKDRADFKLGFSKMTFTHEMIRPFLFEQVYRALTIIKGKKYHW
jgi:23S rRNA (pseudouridine1915-N3)-methyltransferase